MDSHTSAKTSWRSLEEAREYHNEPVICTTVGYLVVSDRKGLTLAMSTSPSGYLGALWFVPRGMVQKIRRLRARK